LHMQAADAAAADDADLEFTGVFHGREDRTLRNLPAAGQCDCGGIRGLHQRLMRPMREAIPEQR
jgi:hypothetical protein